ncbi:hypothetical protein Syun_022021 [Stephania yunnanensis]|uniref:Fungal lipase-type domain-containing protein n=1 Tax=Stephania yunnanensis TaxID=152371 RepID=A0AAP0NR74_9MAGN
MLITRFCWIIGGASEDGRRVRAPRSVEGRKVAVGGRGGDAAAVVGGERAEYEVVFVGHSLGSGVAALAAMVVANCWELLGGVPRNKVRCYAVAPVRCVSRGLAEKYADVIQSVALQVLLP